MKISNDNLFYVICSCNKRKIESFALNYNGLYYQEKLILNTKLKEWEERGKRISVKGETT